MLYIAADALLTNFAIESLKQLNNSASAPPGCHDKARVVVAAQFAIDAPGGQQIPRYIFDECSGGDLGRSIKGYLDAPDNMTEQQALISFLEWVYERPECQTKNYALILWGHGPELLLQPPPGDPTGDSASLYITPEELREAITEAVPIDRDTKKRRLNIVGFDACSMSMFEMAYELRGLTDYMVASQEEVPDPSFPYDSLVAMFRKYGDQTELLIKQGVRAYVSAYQDYVCNAITGMKRVTLSAFDLRKCGALEKAIRCLACALLASQNDSGLPALLIEARGDSRDYAGGLYVDLVEFCTNLHWLLDAIMSVDEMNAPDDMPCPPEGDVPQNFGVVAKCNGNNLKNSVALRKKIKRACLMVLDALRLGSDGTPTGLILANCSADTRSHGLSIYLPYLSDEQYAQVAQPMVKGGIGTIGKGFSDVLNSAAPGLLMCARRDLIIVTEGYYDSLRLASDTAWYCFITMFWSRILIVSDPNNLDFRYSAQQAAFNACRKQCKAAEHCKAETNLQLDQ